MGQNNIILIILVIILAWIIVITIINTLIHYCELPNEADIVIIGGGTAGCVMVRRLREKYPNKSIVVLDRGKDYRNDRAVYRIENAINIAFSAPYSEIVIPTDAKGSDPIDVSCSIPIMYGGGSSHNLSLVVEGSDYFHETMWEPQFNTTQEEFDLLSEKINSLMDIMPLPVSIDVLAKLLPSLGILFSKGIVEIKQGIDVLKHVGPLRASDNFSIWIHNAITSSISSQPPLTNNYNSGIGPCVCDTPQLFADKVLGVRASVNRAYLPLNDQSNYKKVEFASVNHISVDESTLQTTITLDDDRTIVAKEKVIMATGAIYTPLILLNSPTLNNNTFNSIKSSIGQSLMSHYGCTMVLAIKPKGANSNNSIAANVDFSSGPLAFIARPNGNPSIRDWQIVTSGSTLTNLEFLQNQGIDTDYFQNNGYNFVTFLGWDLIPKTRGSVINSNSNSVDVFGKKKSKLSQAIKPQITLNLFQNQEDNDSIVELLRYLGQIANKMTDTINTFDNPKIEDIQILFPEPDVFERNNYNELLDNAKVGVSLTDHYCGTCEYGVVLNEDFSLKGYPNIHVVDASTFPSIPDGNTEYPVLLIAELAATRI